jgi:hypothetical protein
MMPKVEPLPAPAAREGAMHLSIAADSFEPKHPAKKIQGHAPTRRRWPRPSPGLTRRASAIHNLGHFLCEVEAAALVTATLETYGRLPVEFVRALGGDQVAPSLHCIDGGEP